MKTYLIRTRPSAFELFEYIISAESMEAARQRVLEDNSGAFICHMEEIEDMRKSQIDEKIR